MRNLLKFAIAFGVVLSETDTEELGFEPTIEAFKDYFEIPVTEDENSGFLKSPEFKVSDNSGYFNQLEKKETKGLIAKEKAPTPAAEPATPKEQSVVDKTKKEADEKLKSDAVAAKAAKDAEAAKKKADSDAVKLAATNAKADAIKKKADAKLAADAAKAAAKAESDKKKLDALKNVELNQREKVYLMIRNEEAKKDGLTRKQLQSAILHANPEFNAGAIWACFKHFDARKESAFEKEKIILAAGNEIKLYDFKLAPVKDTKAEDDAKAAKAAEKAKAAADKLEAKKTADAAKLAKAEAAKAAAATKAAEAAKKAEDDAKKAAEAPVAEAPKK